MTNSVYPIMDFLQQAERRFNSYSAIINLLLDYYAEEHLREINDAWIKAFISLKYRDIGSDFFELEVEKTLASLIYIITHYAQVYEVKNPNQTNQDKPYQYIHEQNGKLKITAKRNPPHENERGKRDMKTFKSYDRKLYNSISRSRRTIYDLAVCNDWEYFVTLTINKKRYDRYNLDAYMSALKKWLANYSIRKTGGRKIKYLLVPEKGKSGAWHVHGLMSGIPRDHLSFFEKGKHLKRLVNKKYLNWKAYGDKFGFCLLCEVQSKDGIAGYVTKRVTRPKEMQLRKLKSRLYYCSQGLKRPTEICRGVGIIPIDKYDFENEHVGIGWLNL
jgi:hypothetical protein